MRGDHDILSGIFVELSLPGARYLLTNIHITFRMADPCSWTENDRKAELLGKGKRLRNHIMRFLQGCRIKAWYTGKMCITPCILFVLRTVSERIIRTHYDKTTSNSCISTRHKRVGSNIESDMFHGAE